MTSSQVAIITGAGSGIGRAVSQSFYEAGMNVALVGRTHRKLEQTVERLQAGEDGGSDDGRTLLAATDVSEPDAARRLVEAVMDRWGRIDVLVNNAGVAPLAPIDATTRDLLYQTFDANTFGPAYLTAACWPIMCTQQSGCVINISSMATVDPFPGFFIYAASKAALESFTRSIHNEGREHGIEAYTLAPGAVETPTLRANFGEDVLPPEQVMPPEEVAKAVIDCAARRRADEAGGVILLNNR